METEILTTKPPSHGDEELNLGAQELARWGGHFACRTPEKIRVRRTAAGFQCRGCSGCCGTSHFELEAKLQQVELLKV